MFVTALAASVLLGSFQADGGQPLKADLASYRQERAKAGRDAPSQVKLALWCEANGLDAERIEHLAIAVMTDPSNAAARGLLGLVADSGKWRQPEDIVAKIQADAKVSAALGEYADRRAKAPKTADGHWLTFERTGSAGETYGVHVVRRFGNRVYRCEGLLARAEEAPRRRHSRQRTRIGTEQEEGRRASS